jgi:hypothetical protein
MNLTPDQSQRDLPVVLDRTETQEPRSSFGLPSSLSLERIQGYLAPLESLGKQKVAWLGSILLFIGIFLPTKAASVPFLNITVSASFWDFAKFESFLLMLLALASAGLAYIRDYKWLWATGIAISFFLLIEFFDAVTHSYIHPSWGWLILFPAVLLILAAAALRRDPMETSGDAAAVVRDLMQRMSQAR